MASRKTGTGIQAQIRRELQRSGKITHDKIKQIVFLTLSDAETERYQPKKKGNRCTTKDTLLNLIARSYSSKLNRFDWAKYLGIKQTKKKGFICENWTPPTTVSIEAVKLPV